MASQQEKQIKTASEILTSKWYSKKGWTDIDYDELAAALKISRKHIWEVNTSDSQDKESFPVGKLCLPIDIDGSIVMVHYITERMEPLAKMREKKILFHEALPTDEDIAVLESYDIPYDENNDDHIDVLKKYLALRGVGVDMADGYKKVIYSYGYPVAFRFGGIDEHGDICVEFDGSIYPILPKNDKVSFSYQPYYNGTVIRVYLKDGELKYSTHKSISAEISYWGTTSETLQTKFVRSFDITLYNQVVRDNIKDGREAATQKALDAVQEKMMITLYSSEKNREKTKNNVYMFLVVDKDTMNESLMNIGHSFDVAIATFNAPMVGGLVPFFKSKPLKEQNHYYTAPGKESVGAPNEITLEYAKKVLTLGHEDCMLPPGMIGSELNLTMNEEVKSKIVQSDSVILKILDKNGEFPIETNVTIRPTSAAWRSRIRGGDCTIETAFLKCMNNVKKMSDEKFRNEMMLGSICITSKNQIDSFANAMTNKLYLGEWLSEINLNKSISSETKELIVVTTFIFAANLNNKSEISSFYINHEERKQNFIEFLVNHSNTINKHLKEYPTMDKYLHMTKRGKIEDKPEWKNIRGLIAKRQKIEIKDDLQAFTQLVDATIPTSLIKMYKLSEQMKEMFLSTRTPESTPSPASQRSVGRKYRVKA